MHNMKCSSAVILNSLLEHCLTNKISGLELAVALMFVSVCCIYVSIKMVFIVSVLLGNWN